jgi:hypothetical protein
MCSVYILLIQALSIKAGMRPSSASVLQTLMITGMSLTSLATHAQNFTAARYTTVQEFNSSVLATKNISTSTEPSDRQAFFKFKLGVFKKAALIQRTKSDVPDAHRLSKIPTASAESCRYPRELARFRDIYFVRLKPSTASPAILKH